MDTFSAVPSFKIIPIKMLDIEKFDVESEDDIPTITKKFLFYEKGPGCPAIIVMEIDRIETEYSANYPREQGDMTINEYLDERSRVNTLLRRNMLLAICNKLDMDTANVLANEDNYGRRILELTGWLDEPVPFPSPVENTEEGEALTVVETGQ